MTERIEIEHPDGPAELAIGDVIKAYVNDQGEIVWVEAFGQRVWEMGSNTLVADWSKVFVIVDNHYDDAEVATMMHVVRLLEGLRPEEAQRVIAWASDRLSNHYEREGE